MDMAARVTAALAASVVPSVIARGGEVRVLAVEDGVVLLAARGSPGATLPLIARIETLIRAAVPEVRGVRWVGGEGQASPGQAPADFAERVRRVLDAEINPTIAAHRGRVVLVEAEQGWVRVRLEGGCQGCSLAEVTLRQGIEPLLRARLPEMVGLVDITDHEAGTQPFFSPAKR
jgi:Fe-S cluster biogenesis protein NfuA